MSLARAVPMGPALGMLVGAAVRMCGISCAAGATLGTGEAIYVTDMATAQPAGDLVRGIQRDKWQLIPYQTATLEGTMVGALSYINAGELTIPLDVQGWHHVYLAYWNPSFDWDGEFMLRAKLSGRKGFRLISENKSNDTQDATYLRECYFDTDNLTGQDVVIGKCNGIRGRKTYLAYIKLVPMTDEEIALVRKDRADPSTRNLVSTIDGLSYFHYAEFSTSEDILQLVELYRHSDVGKVLWAANYGDRTNYPSEVKYALFVDEWIKFALGKRVTNSYMAGQLQMHDTLMDFASRGIIAQQVVAEHVHEMGIKFDLMFRLGILGKVPRRPGCPDLVGKHPEWRQKLADGTILEKASYAFPEVRQFMLDLIRESTSQIDADGINLCFVRGPHMLWYEEPILARFRELYQEDAREVDPQDPRLWAVRGSFMTQFLRDVRKVLDVVGGEKNRRLELSVWVWPSTRRVWLGKTTLEEGLDVKAWIKEGLLDSVLCQEGIDEDYVELGKANGCEFVLFTGYRGDLAMSPATVTAAYEKGVEQFAFWDMDCSQLQPHIWSWLRRIGHRGEMADWDPEPFKTRSIRLRTVDGVDVEKGLAAAVYSGG